ncbi:hypothetical protein SAMN06309944_0638 [Micrococcales bacterium KH10]|nr:hypothetical protein SAMN06309944_0638 [Micrococcales bacterium KH10]
MTNVLVANSRAYAVTAVGLVAFSALFGTSVPVAREAESAVVRPYAPVYSPTTLSGTQSVSVVSLESESVTPSDLLTELRADTAFTWEQLAKLFGVSRRTLHLWAAGGNLTAQNEERLNALVREVRAIKAAGASDERMQLLALLDRQRSERASQDTDINRPASVYAAVADA